MTAETDDLFTQLREVIHEEVSKAIILKGSTLYMDTPEAAKYLGVSPQYLEGARHRGEGPPYSKLVRRVKYTRADLDAWMASRRLDPEAA